MINIPRRKYLAFLSIDMSTMLCNKHISMFAPLTCTLVAYNRRDMLLFELDNAAVKVVAWSVIGAHLHPLQANKLSQREGTYIFELSSL